MLSLMLTRRFAPLFWCQFFSAFSDNFLKNALVFLILFHPDIGGSHAGALVTLAAAALLIPLAARIYSGAVLRTGSTIKLRDAWRASASAPSASARG